VSDIIALLDNSAADDVMATLALAADTANRHHHHLMTFDPSEPRLHDLHSHADQKHGKSACQLYVSVLTFISLLLLIDCQERHPTFYNPPHYNYPKGIPFGTGTGFRLFNDAI